ncbi:MAG TPA: GNAT family N-acetyltransferase [Acidisoma sp.]|jgi:ribosomal-protein-alanine N-acetyltransferase|uniref:GNAT family N-acetyltransferase n=1 Tax=Acidisoma sp. TaxID=1872115 RepID=UPI002C7266B8|nr:GNAT family N-acetyltransferase [Acidisoma sp.]HTI00023.1 GNAT family N-acetyltransferase [Acidisoma sp.]
MSIDLVGPAYAPVLAAIHALSFPRERWDAATFQQQLEMHGVLGLLDSRGGMILLRVTADEAEILTLGTVPAMRRLGIAAGLLADALDRAARLGARSVFLEVEVDNTPALGLYAAAGFAEVGRRRAYYANGSDALVLRADLPSPPPD